ncbi:MAG TPA: BatA domain-containing protein, partial [Povalibacter sp.]|nr:BatA domain-containing protein [Povalibacter sp.]
MFLAPAILAGLLAIALPLWLHRVARANPQRYPFASLMLLENSEVQRTAQRTLRYWLLLALRIALLIALALAFAGPLLPRRAVPVVSPAGRLHAIVLDTSLSMQYGDRWRRAVTQAHSIIDAARPGDQLLVVEAAGRRVRALHNAVN